jgi:anaerobic magnesium-protoporphyrin IX monomethyl ester cyclase
MCTRPGSFKAPGQPKPGHVSRSIVIVPPFLKHFGGPMAGPAYLKGAGERAGHAVEVVDLNRAWIKERIRGVHVSGPIKGDHDKPSAELNRLYHEWQELCAAHWPCGLTRADWERSTVVLHATHDDITTCAENLSRGSFGDWCERQLSMQPQPDVIGISVMFSGQVIAALAVTEVVRRVWPAANVVWGGAHVTALADHIGADPAYGRCIDGFVAGYAEKTWVRLLDAVASGATWPPEVFRAGSRPRRAEEDSGTVPAYDLIDYSSGSLTLPVQASRGCAYGKCAFCTYPKVEGQFRMLNIALLEPVIQQAVAHRAVLSFKDSLLVPSQIKEVGALIAGRVMWSACTKLSDSFKLETLRQLYASGLRTLEIGLETLHESSQELIGKQQSLHLFRRFLDAAAASGVGVVVNYMTGLPGADATEERDCLQVVRSEVAARPSLIARIEHNTFQLEMLSPMAQRPADYGIEVLRSWPWSSLLEFRVRMPVSSGLSSIAA